MEVTCLCVHVVNKVLSPNYFLLKYSGLRSLKINGERLGVGLYIICLLCNIACRY